MMLPNRSPILASRVGKPIPTDLAAWYRYNTGITSASGTVSAWANQTGGEALVQATAGNRPTLESDGTILFNGVDQFLKTAPFTLDQPTTVYFLGRQVTWTANRRIYDGNALDSMRLTQQGASPNNAMNAGGTQIASDPDITLGEYGIITCVFNGASSRIQTGLNAAVTGDAGTNNAGGFTLGAAGNGGNPANFQGKEILLYAAAHDANQRAAVIAYLNMVNQL
jgi:hypothetical protein